MPQLPSTMNGVTLTFGTNVNRDVGAALITALTSVLKPYVYGKLLATGGWVVVEDASLVEQEGRFTVSGYRISGGSEAAGHSPSSRHPQRKAVDVSRITGTLMRNGNVDTGEIFMQTGYVEDPQIRAIVRKIQRAIETTPGRRENFGPYVLKKLGVTLTPQNRAGYASLAEKHKNHVHFSIN